MTFEVFYCEDIQGESCLSERSVHVTFKNKVMRFPDGNIEVTFKAHNEVTGHYPHINSYFYDTDEELEDDARKYFAQLTWWQIFQLRLLYNYFWWQKPENIWQIILAIGGIIAFMYYVLKGDKP